jgi:hypothetical protein
MADRREHLVGHTRWKNSWQVLRPHLCRRPPALEGLEEWPLEPTSAPATLSFRLTHNPPAPLTGATARPESRRTWFAPRTQRPGRTQSLDGRDRQREADPCSRDAQRLDVSSGCPVRGDNHRHPRSGARMSDQACPALYPLRSCQRTRKWAPWWSAPDRTASPPPRT